jgi:subtilisin family serine protease
MRKPLIRSGLLPACAAVVLCVLVLLWGAPRPEAQSTRGARVADELLVRFQPGADAGKRAAALARARGSVKRHFQHLDLDHIQVPAGTADAALLALSRDPDVAGVQPNYIRHVTATTPPNDPYWLNGALWGLIKINAQTAWNTFSPSAHDVVVGIIDTGVNYNHPDLASSVWTNPGEVAGNGLDDDGDGYVDDVHGIDTANHDSDPLDDEGHGTHTAGTVGARGNNGVGVTGVAWNPQIAACKFLDSTGSGSDANAVACFNYFVDLKLHHGVNLRVTSNSWGEQRDPNQPFPTVLKAAIDAAGNAGIVNVFAAGNSNNNNDVTPFDPASFTSASIVAVAASDQADARASFSNYGATSVDLAAPGVNILSTVGSDYGYASGTSMAAPHVAGAFALMASANPSLSVSALKARLLASVDPIPAWTGVVATGGRLNVYQALSSAYDNLPPTVSVTAPADGTTATAPATVTVSASASDADGSVSQVAFYANGAPIGTDATAPYSITWSGVAAGSYTLTAVATDNGGATTTSAGVTFAVAPPGGTAPAASFVRTDSATQGNWVGNYGAKGYSIADIAPSLPADTRVTFTDATPYTWVSSTTDPRALLRPGSTTRAATTWYGSVFTADVDLGAGTRRVALYFLDWDVRGRGETIEVRNATTGALLDTRTAANFGNGQYLVWNVTGHVSFRVTGTAGPNTVLSAIFFDTAATGGNAAPTVNLTAPANGATATAPATVTVSANAADSDGSITQVAFYAGTTLIGTDATAPYSLTWSGVAAGTYTLTAVATDNGGATTTSSGVTFTVTAAGGTAAAASFVRSDRTTQGNWIDAYGTSGYTIADIPSSLPSDTRVTFTDATAYTWVSSTTDPRALIRPGSANHAATTWYGSAFTADVDLGAGTRQVALYFLDWDVRGRAEAVEVRNAITGALLDTQTAANFGNGQYLVWTVTGHVTFRVAGTAGPNTVLSAIFFDTAATGGNARPTVSLTSPASGATGTAPATFTVSADAADADGTIAQVAFYAGATLIGTDATAPYSLTWSGVAAGTYTLTAVATDNAGAATTSSGVTVGVSPAGGTPASASFVRSDTTTQGNWIGAYGTAGYSIADLPASLPAGTRVTLTDATPYTWVYSTTDARALLKPGGATRSATTWYGSVFTADVDLGASTRTVSLYFLDWDFRGRAESIEVRDATTGALLDTRSAPSFGNGQYLVWNVTGHVTFRVIGTAGTNTVLSAIFID